MNLKLYHHRYNIYLKHLYRRVANHREVLDINWNLSINTSYQSFVRHCKLLLIYFASIILKTFHLYLLWASFDLNMYVGFISVFTWLLAFKKEIQLKQEKMCILGFLILLFHWPFSYTSDI